MPKQGQGSGQHSGCVLIKDFLFLVVYGFYRACLGSFDDFCVQRKISPFLNTGKVSLKLENLRTDLYTRSTGHTIFINRYYFHDTPFTRS